MASYVWLEEMPQRAVGEAGPVVGDLDLDDFRVHRSADLQPLPLVLLTRIKGSLGLAVTA